MNDDFEEEKIEITAKEDSYDDIVTEEPERPIDLPEGGGVTTLSEAEEQGAHVSDIQAIAKHLHFQYKDKMLNEILQSAASSRIFADNLLDKGYAIVANYLEDHEFDEECDPIFIINVVQDACSRGFEGRQRIEDLELAGVIHEEELEKIAQSMGV